MFHLWEMNSSATRSLFSPCLGRLNHLLYKPGKLFIRAEVKGGGGWGGAAAEEDWGFFFFLFLSFFRAKAEKCEEQTSRSICSTV